MTMGSNNRANDTALRVLAVLKLLYEKKIQLEEIMSHLFSDKNTDYSFRKDVLYKYFNTFKLLGINIIKEHKLFYLEKSPILVNFTQEEIAGMKFLLEYSKTIYSPKSHEEIQNLIKKLCNCAQNYNFKDLQLSEAEKNKYKNLVNHSHNPDLIDKFRLLCKEKQKISFTYFNSQLNEKQEFIAEPEEVVVTPFGCILKAHNTNIAETQNFYIEYIEDLKQLPVMSKPINVKSSVTFALTGRLAAAYELKPGERLTKREPNYLVVTNSGEDKDALMKRLLRYGKSCEILYPKTFCKKTLTTLNKILQNYS